MKTRPVAVLLLSGSVLFGPAAVASDELAGALIGAGAGAVIGNAIDRHDGAVVGGILGAMLGAAIADDDDGAPRRGYRPDHLYRPAYGPPPVVFYFRPPVRYPPAFIHDGHAHPPGQYKHWQAHDDRRGDGWGRDDERGPGRGGRGPDDRDGRRRW